MLASEPEGPRGHDKAENISGRKLSGCGYEGRWSERMSKKGDDQRKPLKGRRPKVSECMSVGRDSKLLNLGSLTRLYGMCCLAAYWAKCEQQRGGAVNANERETGDLLPSAVSLRYTTRELEGNGGRAGTGTRIEDEVEALGARNCEVGRGVATRSRRDGDVNATRGSRTSRVVDEAR